MFINQSVVTIKNMDNNKLDNRQYFGHKNPYHDKLIDFQDFVLRDDEGEKFKGVWVKEVFKNNYDLNVEVGCGFGEFMNQYSQDHLNENFIGMDYRFKRSFEVAQKLSLCENSNFRLLRANAERLNFLFSKEEVKNIFYFFPDPWPKKRHFKRRLFNQDFLAQCHEILNKDGILWVKTDHDGYFDWMIDALNLFNSNKRFEILFLSKNFDQDMSDPNHILKKYRTKFEKIFISQKIPIKCMILKKVNQ